MSKLAIIGSRGFNDYTLLRSVLDPYKDVITLVVSGGAKGADSLAERWAKENGIQVKIFLPDWDKHGKKAGLLRNDDIIKNSDGVVAFWDGSSRGTQHSIELAKKQNKKIKIITYA